MTRQKDRPMKPAHFNPIGKLGCPGSYTVAKPPLLRGAAVCPFCFQDKHVNHNGTLRAHRRPR